MHYEFDDSAMNPPLKEYSIKDLCDDAYHSKMRNHFAIIIQLKLIVKMQDFPNYNIAII